MKLKYSVLGAGAMGSVFGARLALQGHPVELLNRTPDHAQAIKEQGGLICHLDKQKHLITLQADLVTKAKPADVVFLFTKTYQIKEALANLPATLRPAHFITLQNGLGNGQQVAAYVGIDQTVEGVSIMPAEFIKPGEVGSAGSSETWMFSANGEHSEIVNQVGEDLNQAGLKTHVTGDVRTFIWQKACFNMAMNALCSLVDGSPGLLQQFPDGRQLAHEIAEEAITIAQLEGALVNPEKVHGLIDYACVDHTYHRPSMLQDLKAQRLTEIESLNGYLVAAARKHGKEVPLAHLMARLIRLRERAPEFWATEPIHH
ncbi:MAG: ketopantoate reductase family protein [Deltaproteobacteria bacterium]